MRRPITINRNAAARAKSSGVRNFHPLDKDDKRHENIHAFEPSRKTAT